MNHSASALVSSILSRTLGRKFQDVAISFRVKRELQEEVMIQDITAKLKKSDNLDKNLNNELVLLY